MLNDITTALVKRELESAKKASIAIGVVTKNGKFIMGEIFDDMRDLEIGDCIFEIGSTTKTFTSLLLAKLVQENVIALDEPIKSYKLEYERALTYNGREVTFRHLSTHRSGLPREDMATIRKRIKENKQEKDNPYKHFTSEDLHQFYVDFDLKRVIDKKWKYSNVAVSLLGNTLAEILGVTYEEAIQTHILNPLAMTDTFITGNEERIKSYVKAYNNKGERILPIELPAMNPAGALKSTIHDMLHYLECQIGLKDSPLNAAMNFTHQVHAKTTWKNTNMGLGWLVEQKKWSQYPIIHHGGRTMGFHTYCGFIKEEQIGIVIFSTIQLKIARMLKMILNLTGGVNENIAEAIFKTVEGVGCK